MRKIVLAFMALLVLSSHKDLHPTEILVRVDTRETANAIASELPKLLLEAFKNGEIRAYYPADPEQEMSFNAFTRHFNLPAKEYPKGTNEALECQGNAYVIDPYVVKAFCMFDLLEHHAHSRRGSVKKRDVQWVRLVFGDDYSQTGLEYYGPVFKAEDIERLKAKIQHPENVAVKYLPKDILKMHLYSATYIKKGEGDVWQKPAKKSEKEKAKEIDLEGGYYEN